MALWHKKFADLLNIVVIMKTHLRTQAVAHVVLFSSDLELPYHHLIDYDRLCVSMGVQFSRCQTILGPGRRFHDGERNPPVYNSANLAMFMVNVLPCLDAPDAHALAGGKYVNDLQAWCRSKKYVVETLKLLPEMPEPIFIDQAIAPKWLDLGG